MDHQAPEVNPWVAKLLENNRDEIHAALDNRIKHERGAAVSACKAKLVAELGGEDEEQVALVKAAFGDAKDVVFREMILDGKRVDGRDTKTVRPIVCDLDVIPRAHGHRCSLVVKRKAWITLYARYPRRRIDDRQSRPESLRSFMLHYNFPGFSVGECGGRPGPGRREIGHGALARRAWLKTWCLMPMSGPTPFVWYPTFWNRT